MTEKREKAALVLSTASKIVMTERGNQHGGAEDSFTMIAQLWNIWLTNTNKMRHNNPVHLVIEASDVAQMMSLLKKARHVHGDPSNDDNFIDDTGYTALAAMLVGQDDLEEAITASMGAASKGSPDKKPPVAPAKGLGWKGMPEEGEVVKKYDEPKAQQETQLNVGGQQ